MLRRIVDAVTRLLKPRLPPPTVAPSPPPPDRPEPTPQEVADAVEMVALLRYLEGRQESRP